MVRVARDARRRPRGRALLQLPPPSRALPLPCACHVGRFFFDLFGGLPIDWAFESTWLALAGVDFEEEIAQAAAEGDNAVQAVGLLKTMKLGKLFKMLKLLKLAIRMLRLARRSRVRRVTVTTATTFAEVRAEARRAVAAREAASAALVAAALNAGR